MNAEHDTMRDLEPPSPPTFEEKMEAIIEIILEPFYSRVGASKDTPYSRLVSGLVDFLYEQACLSKQGLPLTTSPETVRHLMQLGLAYDADREEKKRGPLEWKEV